MKVLAFGASNSKKSINKMLATYTAELIENSDIEILDLNDFELPLFSEDIEADIGQPALAKSFFDKIGSCDVLVISFAEHNGSYSAAYKNLFDWCSRIDKGVFQNKPLILLATSPGPGGAKSVLAQAEQSSSFFLGLVKATVSVPSFYDNFNMETGKISNEAINAELFSAVNSI